MAQLDKDAAAETTAPVMHPFVHEEEVRVYLDRYAHAITSGDARAIARMWGIPALVLSDHGVRTVSSSVEVEDFFAGAKEQYAARGIVDTRPDIQYVEWLTTKIVIADVRWPLFDEDHVERGFESSTYTLMRDDSGALALRVVVMRGETHARPAEHAPGAEDAESAH